jgi:hypothetical protein
LGKTVRDKTEVLLGMSEGTSWEHDENALGTNGKKSLPTLPPAPLTPKRKELDLT